MPARWCYTAEDCVLPGTIILAEAGKVGNESQFRVMFQHFISNTAAGKAPGLTGFNENIGGFPISFRKRFPTFIFEKYSATGRAGCGVRAAGS